MRYGAEHAQRERDQYRLLVEQLRSDLADKAREMTNISLSLVKKTELIDHLKQSLANLAANSLEREEQLIAPILQTITDGNATGDSWGMFEGQFEQVHQDFMRTLANTCPELTPTELKVATLIRIDLTTKEIADVLHSSHRSVQNHRYRIRKKLGIGAEVNLTTYLAAI